MNTVLTTPLLFRALSAQTVLIDSYGTLKMTDFGLYRHTSAVGQSSLWKYPPEFCTFTGEDDWCFQFKVCRSYSTLSNMINLVLIGVLPWILQSSRQRLKIAVLGGPKATFGVSACWLFKWYMVLEYHRKLSTTTRPQNLKAQQNLGAWEMLSLQSFGGLQLFQCPRRRS